MDENVEHSWDIIKKTMKLSSLYLQIYLRQWVIGCTEPTDKSSPPVHRLLSQAVPNVDRGQGGESMTYVCVGRDNSKQTQK